MRLFKKKKKMAQATQETSRSEAIAILKQENDKLREELAFLKSRESLVVDAIGLAKQKASEYVDEAKIRYTLEMERLTEFSAKWQAYTKNLDRAEELGRKILETEINLKKCKDELGKIIDEDFGSDGLPLKNYCDEEIRLGEIKAKQAETDTNLSDSDLKDLILQLINK